MPSAVHYWTPDEVRALPDDGNRYECIGGELVVSPSPRVAHQRVLGRLHIRLAEYLATNPVGELMMSPADIEMVKGNLVQPDLFVIAGGPAHITNWPDIRALLLSIEILSPSTARYDRGIKRKFYMNSPTSEYWIVDADSRAIERWRRGDDRPEVATGTLVWVPAGASEAMQLDLAELFDAVNPE